MTFQWSPMCMKATSVKPLEELLTLYKFQRFSVVRQIFLWLLLRLEKLSISRKDSSVHLLCHMTCKRQSRQQKHMRERSNEWLWLGASATKERTSFRTQAPKSIL